MSTISILFCIPLLLLTTLSCRQASVRPEALKPADEAVITNGPWNLDTNRLASITWPGGKARCLVLSFDDGLTEDRPLAALFNKYHLKGSFNLNSGRFGQKVFWLKDAERWYISSNEVKQLYSGHEVACHTVDHPDLPKIDPKSQAYQVRQDRTNLERLIGSPVHGLAYPMGLWNQPMLPRLDALGITYARTVKNTGKFSLPSNLLAWNPTSHYKAATNFVKRFFDAAPSSAPLLFIWGHSWEIGKTNDTAAWKDFENLCASLGGHDDTWYASCMEVAEYLKAANALNWITKHSIYNPSSNITVWLRDQDKQVGVGPLSNASYAGGEK